jgi:hypothetical protein
MFMIITLAALSLTASYSFAAGGPAKPAAPPKAPAAAKAATKPAAKLAPVPAIAKLDILVERKRTDRIERVDPATVFNAGDLVRFRFRSNFPGFLYVMNEGTSGAYTLLFPRADTGEENRIEAGKEYRIPMTEEGWFQIAGPAGHEVMYWLISVDRRESRTFPLPALPSTAEATGSDARITPRCDDAIFRARGECLDPAAGPQVPGENLPSNLTPYAVPARDLTVLKSGKSTAVAVPSSQRAPFLYTFRLAHR